MVKFKEVGVLGGFLWFNFEVYVSFLYVNYDLVV